VVANLQWQTVQEEDSQNVHLLEFSNQILEPTNAVHDFTTRLTDPREGGNESSPDESSGT